MVIKAENRVGQKDVDALIHCNSAKVKFMLILLFIIFAAFTIFGIARGNSFKSMAVYFAGIIWCIVVYVYVFLLNPKITYKSFKKKYTENAAIKYQFTERSVGISIENENGKTEKRYNYRDMFKIYETPEYFFIYAKRSESYIMKKSGLTQRTAAELSEMIEKENPKAFIRKVR